MVRSQAKGWPTPQGLRPHLPASDGGFLCWELELLLESGNPAQTLHGIIQRVAGNRGGKYSTCMVNRVEKQPVDVSRGVGAGASAHQGGLDVGGRVVG